MRSFFEELKDDGETAIDRWIAEKQAETLFFDCCVKADASHGNLNEDDKRNLARTLTAFANSAGGTLLWGVEAKVGVGHGELDCLRVKKPISGIDLFCSRCLQLVTELTDKPLQDLEHYIIRSDEDTKSGYLVMYSPQSDFRPHLCLAKGGRGFYVRNGDQTLPMERFQIEDQFNRKKVPKLQFDWTIGLAGSRSNEGKFYQSIAVDFVLKNESSMSALHPYLYIYAEKNQRIISKHPVISLTKRPTNETKVEFRFSGDFQCIIHPYIDLIVAELLFEVSANPLYAYYKEVPKRVRYLEMKLDCVYGCLDAPPQRASLVSNDFYSQLALHGIEVDSGPT